MKKIKIKDFLIGDKNKLTIIAGPCVIESFDHALNSAKELNEIFKDFDFNFVFKSSFDKANRSSVNSFRGVGLDNGIEVFKKIKQELDLPITTDIHLPNQVEKLKDVIDIFQIPAFLCRQTDLLIAAANTKKAVNVKKGQFLAPWDMKNVVDKILSTGNDNIILTDRGVTFGYNNLVTDIRAIPIMQEFGFPVCFDATHSLQLPGGLKTHSGGEKKFISPLTKAAVAAGANAIFIEAHPDPKNAKSDSAIQVSFTELRSLLIDIEKIFNANYQLC